MPELEQSFTTREEQYRRKFERFHTANPRVWDLFKLFTLQLIHRGFKHYSADAIVHRIRWHSAIEATCDVAKINNCHTAHYARLFHREFPAHDGFFRNRALVSSRANTLVSSMR
jgi:hypothetical protein